MRVFDTFIFFNELDLLEIRLNELDKYVDYFVIVESDLTFTLKPKPLYYEENKERFKKFAHKIIHYKITFKGGGSAWGYEFTQRNAIKDALICAGAELNDVILLSDVDEIPNLKGFDFNLNGAVWSMQMQYYYYWLNNKMNETQYIMKAFEFRRLATMSMQDVRAYQQYSKWQPMGWHFSYLGGAEKIKHKIESFSHQEMNKPEFVNTIKERIESGKDLFDRNYNFELVSIDGFPEHIINNKEKFKHLIR